MKTEADLQDENNLLWDRVQRLEGKIRELQKELAEVKESKERWRRQAIELGPRLQEVAK